MLLSGASAQIAHAPENAAAIAKGIKTVLDELAPVAPHPVAIAPLPVIERPDTLVLPEIERPDTLNLCIQNHSDERAAKTGVDLAAHDVVTGLALRGLKEVDSLEREIQARGLPAARYVTPADIEAEIAAEYSTTLDKALAGCPLLEGMDRVTVAVIVLKNGTKLVGVNYGAIDPARHSPEMGAKEARAAAIEQAWPLLGFRLRDELARPVLTEADALADLAGEPRPS